MKILVVCSYYSPDIGAAPIRLASMASGLAALGHEVEVVTSLPSYPLGRIFEPYRGHLRVTEERQGVTVRRLWAYPTVSHSALKRGFNMLSFASAIWGDALTAGKALKYDAVIVQSPPLPAAVSALALYKVLLRRPVIVNLSDIWPLTAVELGAMRPGSAPHRVFSAMERYIYDNATAILGQSQEILEHVGAYHARKGSRPQPAFLYRNLKSRRLPSTPRHRLAGTPLRVVYAGLLGVAQDILTLISTIDFRSLDIEFHVYGAGNQADAIRSWLESHPDRNIAYHGHIEPREIDARLAHYDAAVVPLAKALSGAVPSKIFDLMPIGIPILFCGGGEGARIIEATGTGLISSPGDYAALRENLIALRDMSDDQYTLISRKCLQAAAGEFNFQAQLHRLDDFLKSTLHKD